MNRVERLLIILLKMGWSVVFIGALLGIVTGCIIPLCIGMILTIASGIAIIIKIERDL